jgi:hypothetical protein
MPETVGGVAVPFKEGRRVAPALTDLTGDGRPELVLGNWAGGAAFFAGAEPPVHTSVPAYTQSRLRLWPNPVRDVVRVEGDGPLQFVAVYDLYGRVIMQVTGLADRLAEVNVSALPSGVYFLRTAAGVMRFVRM